jgi:putative phosphoribosyl transferase
MITFSDRTEAALLLADKLTDYKHQNAIVLAIPRGGVPIGAIIAKALNIPLDLIMIKKIGHPGNPEYAIGAVSMDGRILNPDVTVSTSYIEAETEKIRKSLRERYLRFTGHEEVHDIGGKIAIIVDDGVATGNTILAAIALASKCKPAKIVVATPVCSFTAAEKIRNTADELVAVLIPEDLYAIGQYYSDFSQVEDEEVIDMVNGKRSAVS